MKDKFIDSNIALYAQSPTDLRKQSIAQNILITESPFISTQVIQECVNNYRRKLKFDLLRTENAVNNLSTLCKVHTNTLKTIQSAVQIAYTYHYSFYDSLIIAAALEANCTILYSEDMHDGHIINGTLTIRNPFL